MINYVAATHTGIQVALWVLAVLSAGYVVLTVMTLLEVRKFSRWSDEHSRECRRRHTAAMRRLAQQRAESERRHAENMRELEARIAALRGPE